MSILEAYDTEFVVVRTPLLSLEDIAGWDEPRKLIEHFLNTPLLAESIFIASASLYAELEKIRSHGVHDEQKLQKLYYTLLKYLIRMSSRSTPYGLFACMGLVDAADIGYHAEASSITISGADAIQFRRRLDMQVLFSLHNHLVEKHLFLRQIRYFRNSSLYRLGDRWKYTKMSLREETITYENLTLATHAVLDSILAAAKAGVDYAGIENCIVSAGYGEEEAEYFIRQLVENQVLVSELYPNPTGEEYQRVLFDKIGYLSQEDEQVREFVRMGRSLERAEKVSIDEYRAIMRGASDLFDFRGKDHFHVDASRGIGAFRVRESSFVHLEPALQALMFYSSPIQLSRLDRLRKIFEQRYGGRLVPLTELFDNAAGVTYEGAAEEEDGFMRIGKGGLKKLRLYEEALKNASRVVELPEVSDVAGTLPQESFYIIGTLLNGGEYDLQLKTFAGPSATVPLTRFSHSDERLRQYMIRCAAREAEMYPDCIVAEISHQPPGKVGNILARAAIRDYEIVYLSGSLKDRCHQLLLEDLLVGLRENEFILYSARHQKRVIPRLSSAHNTNHPSNSGLYQFICDLQYQDRGNDVLFWDWEFLSDRPFLPRVVFRNVVLHPAEWNIRVEIVFDGRDGDESECRRLFGTIRKKYNLPAIFMIVEGDNHLLIDESSTPAVQLFLKMAMQKGALKIRECLSSSGDAVVRDGSRPYAHEVIIPFLKKGLPLRKADFGNFPSTVLREEVQRKFVPGEEWVYLQLYGNPEPLDGALREKIAPLMRSLGEEELAGPWFYLRYGDSGYHLRIRIRVSAGAFGAVVARVNEALKKEIADNTIWKMSYETYFPELEKYGVDRDGMDHANLLFWRSSELCIGLNDLISQSGAGDAELLRMSSAILFLHLMTKELFSGDGERAVFMESCLSSGDVRLKRSRMEHAALLDAMFGLKPGDEIISSLREIVLSSISAQRPALYVLSGDKDRESKIVNHIHVFVNRLFMYGLREKESIVYDHCYHYLKSLAARKNYQNHVSIR